MSRALEQRAVVRKSFEELCDALEKQWVSDPEFRRILDAFPRGSFEDITRGLGISDDNYQKAMRDYFRAMNGL